jgi:hypothetical protein
MRHKIFGFVYWQVGKWYLRRWMRSNAQKASIGGAIAGAAALAVVGAIVAQRQNDSDSE